MSPGEIEKEKAFHPDGIKEKNRFHGAGAVNREQKKNRKTYPCRVVGGTVAEDLFKRGLCLPSGTAMENSDLDRVIEVILNSRPK